MSARPVPSSLIVAVTGEAPPLPADLEAEVVRLWERERSLRPLFDGRVFSIISVEPDCISGHFVPYRRVVAQSLRPELADAIGVRQLGVTGVLDCADGLVLGKRFDGATQDPGLWEFGPSGAIDPLAVAPDGTLDPVRHLLAELEEELGLPPNAVAASIPFLLVEDRKSRVHDLVIHLSCSWSGAAIQATWKDRGSTEYVDLAVIAGDRIAKSLAVEDLAPTSRQILAFLDQERTKT